MASTSRGAIVVAALLLVIIYMAVTTFKRPTVDICAASKKLVGSLRAPLTVKAFVSTNLPSEFRSKALYLEAMLDEFEAASNGEMDWEVLNPSRDEKLKEMARRLKVLPIKMRYHEKNKVSEREVYFGVSFQYGGKVRAILMAGDIDTLEYRISGAISRLTRKKKKIAFTIGHGEKTAQRGLRLIRDQLKDYELTSVDLKEGKSVIPDDVDILVIPGPNQPLAERAKYEIDQFLMKGRSVVYLVDGMILQTPRSQQMPQQQKIQIARANVVGLKDQMAYYGVEINHDMVMNPSIQVMVQTQLGIPMPAALPEPFVSATTLSQESLVTRDLKQYIAILPCSLNITAKVRGGQSGLKATVLATSSAMSWRKEGFFVLSGTTPQEPTKVKGPFNLAIYLQGNFKSFFSGRSVPAPGPAKGPTEKIDNPPDGKGKTSPSSSRLVVIAGSGVIMNNWAKQLGGNTQLFVNTLDVLALDVSLSTIRSEAR